VQNLPYIGLEHISEGQLSLIGYGTSKEVVSIKSLFRQGDILFGKLRPYFRKIIIAPFDGVCSTDIWVVRAKEGTDQRFLFYWMASNEFIEESTRASEGTKMPRAQWNFIERIVRPVPPLPIQRAIAHILGTLDDKIELNRQMNATLEAIARALFQSWFVDLDPVRAKAEGRQPAGMDAETAALFPAAFVDSELGEIPKGWDVKKLADLCSTQYGYTASATELPVGPKFLRVMDINKQNWIEWGDVPYCQIDDEIKTNYALTLGDLVVARMADPGKSAIIEDEIDAVFASYLVRLRTESLAYSYYVYGFLKSDLYTEYTEGAKSGSVQANMNAKVIVGASLVVPPEPLMRRYCDIVFPLRQRIAANARQSRTLAALRDALLPKLISGEIHIKDAEKLVGERL